VYYTQVLPPTNETKGTSISELQETSTSTTTTVIAPQDGPRRLHITNLPFKIRDNELKTMFEVYGTVVDAEIIFNERGSKGFGFVTMETCEAAATAKEALNGKEMDGRKIEVNNATPRATPSKSPLRSKDKNQNSHTSLVKTTSYMEQIPSVQPLQPSQSINNAWATQQAFAFSTPPMPSPQLTALPPQHMAPPPPFSFAAPQPQPMAISGFHCYPTPEQYAAQYYSYMASQGALRTTTPAPKSNTLGGNYRFQPY